MHDIDPNINILELEIFYSIRGKKYLRLTRCSKLEVRSLYATASETKWKKSRKIVDTNEKSKEESREETKR